MRFGILGGGNAGAALAAHLKLLGQHVTLYDAFPAALVDIQNDSNFIEFQGKTPVTGRAQIDTVTGTLQDAVAGADS